MNPTGRPAEFLVVDGRVLDLDIPPGAKLVLAAVIFRARLEGIAFRSVAGYAADCRLTTRHVRSSLRLLCRKGLLEPLGTGVPGHPFTNCYRPLLGLEGGEGTAGSPKADGRQFSTQGEELPSPQGRQKVSVPPELAFRRF
jgi:hypothetical protein